MVATPRFRLWQDAEFVYVEIKVPHVRVSGAETCVEGQNFTFYCKPYLLSLVLPFEVVEDDRCRAKYDPLLDNGTVTAHLPKQQPGQHFPDLDLLGQLLKPPWNPYYEAAADADAAADAAGLGADIRERTPEGLCRPGTGPDWPGKGTGASSAEGKGGGGYVRGNGIEVLSSETFGDGEEESAELASEGGARVVGCPAGAGAGSAGVAAGGIRLGKISYGFNNKHSEFFRHLREEQLTFCQLPEPDATPPERRAPLRVEDENRRFDAERYLADTASTAANADEEDIFYREAMAFRPHWLQPPAKRRVRPAANGGKRDGGSGGDGGDGGGERGSIGGDGSGSKGGKRSDEEPSTAAVSGATHDDGNSINPENGAGNHCGVSTSECGRGNGSGSSSRDGGGSASGGDNVGGNSVDGQAAPGPGGRPSGPAGGSSSSRTAAAAVVVAAADDGSDDDAKGFEFSEEERDVLTRLPRREYLIPQGGWEEASLLLGLADLLFAYAHDHRGTQGEPTVESAWTVAALSPTLSWLQHYTPCPPPNPFADVAAGGGGCGGCFGSGISGGGGSGSGGGGGGGGRGSSGFGCGDGDAYLMAGGPSFLAGGFGGNSQGDGSGRGGCGDSGGGKCQSSTLLEVGASPFVIGSVAGDRSDSAKKSVPAGAADASGPDTVASSQPSAAPRFVFSAGGTPARGKNDGGAGMVPTVSGVAARGSSMESCAFSARSPTASSSGTGAAEATRSEVAALCGVAAPLVWGVRRALIFPYLRVWMLAVTAVHDTAAILAGGKRTVLRCLLQLHTTLQRTETHYLLNKLWVEDYCVWMQGVHPEALRSLAAAYSDAANRLDKASVGLSLTEVEASLSDGSGAFATPAPTVARAGSTFGSSGFNSLFDAAAPAAAAERGTASSRRRSGGTTRQHHTSQPGRRSGAKRRPGSTGRSSGSGLGGGIGARSGCSLPAAPLFERAGSLNGAAVAGAMLLANRGALPTTDR